VEAVTEDHVIIGHKNSLGEFDFVASACKTVMATIHLNNFLQKPINKHLSFTKKFGIIRPLFSC